MLRIRNSNLDSVPVRFYDTENDLENLNYFKQEDLPAYILRLSSKKFVIPEELSKYLSAYPNAVIYSGQDGVL